jgi:replicative DNA helicase
MIATRDQATAAVLGAAFLSPTALDVMTEERIRPAHFRRATERAIYSTMRLLADTGSSVDVLTVKQRLSGAGSPVSEADIDLLAGSVPDLSALRDYCRIVREEAWLADAQQTLHRAQEALAAKDREGAIAAVQSLDSERPLMAKADSAAEFLAWYEHDRQGIKLPFAELTEATGGGFEAGETTILGGWPAMGKTVLAQMCLLTATGLGAKVHEYANEMNGPRRTARLLSSLTGIPSSQIAKRSLSGEEFGKVRAALARLPYESEPTAGWPVEDYCRAIRRRRDDLAVIDTVTNLPCSRVDEWDRACSLLNDAAAQAGTHLVLVCQLNLERDKGAERPTPTGRDLRNTGAWYQRARIVMFVHRAQERVDSDAGNVWRVLPEGHVRVDKATHGEPALGFVEVAFSPRWMTFERLAGGRDWRAELEAA